MISPMTGIEKTGDPQARVKQVHGTPQIQTKSRKIKDLIMRPEVIKQLK